jgi:hypothetical protein
VASIIIKPIISIVRLESEIVAAIKTMSGSVLIEGGTQVSGREDKSANSCSRK